MVTAEAFTWRNSDCVKNRVGRDPPHTRDLGNKACDIVVNSTGPGEPERCFSEVGEWDRQVKKNFFLQKQMLWMPRDRASGRALGGMVRGLLAMRKRRCGQEGNRKWCIEGTPGILLEFSICLHKEIVFSFKKWASEKILMSRNEKSAEDLGIFMGPMDTFRYMLSLRCLGTARWHYGPGRWC